MFLQAGHIDLNTGARHFQTVIRCDAGLAHVGWVCLNSILDPVAELEIATGQLVISMGKGLLH